MDDIFYTLHKNMRTARKRLGLTQADVAALLGITSRQYQRYESGTSSPYVYDLPKICEVLQISLEELFGVNKNESPKMQSKIERLFNQLDLVEQIAIMQVIESLVQKKK